MLRKEKYLVMVLGISCILCLPSCQTSEIYQVSDLPEELSQIALVTGFDSIAKIPKKGNFCWRGGSGPMENSAEAVQYDPSIRIAIAQVMKENRYSNVNPQIADLELGYAYTLDTPLESAQLNQGFGYTGKNAKNNKYKEGTLIIHIFEYKTGKRIWRGSAHAKVAFDAKLTEEVRRQRLLNIIRALMREFFPGRYQ